MSITELFLGTVAETKTRRLIETAAPLASSECQHDQETQGGAAFDLSEVQLREMTAWDEYQRLKMKLESTPLGRQVEHARRNWVAMNLLMNRNRAANEAY